MIIIMYVFLFMSKFLYIVLFYYYICLFLYVSFMFIILTYFVYVIRSHRKAGTQTEIDIHIYINAHFCSNNTIEKLIMKNKKHEFSRHLFEHYL